MRILRHVILVLTLLATVPAMARFVEHAGPVDQAEMSRYEEYKQQAESKWEEAKKKAKSWWASKFGDDKEKPEKRKQPTKVVKAPEAPAGPTHAEQVAELKKELPEFKSNGRNDLKNLVEQAMTEVDNAQTFREVSPGRKADRSLPRTKRGKIPYLSLYENKRIKTKSGKTKVIKIRRKSLPLIDIGEEPTISANELVPPELQVAEDMFKSPKALKSPAMMSRKELRKWTKKKLALVRPAKLKNSDTGLGKVVTEKKVTAVTYDIKELMAIVADKPVKELSKSELNMLAGLILYDKKKCHLAQGLFAKVEKAEKYKEEANFFLGQCAHQMGFHSDAVNRLLKVVRSENPDYTSDAIDSVVESLPREFESKVVRAILNVKNTALIRAKTKGRIHYLTGKVKFRQNEFRQAEDFASLVKPGHEYYPDALFTVGISQYMRKKRSKAVKTLEKTRTWMAKNGRDDKNLESLISINLGRMKFRKNDFKGSIQDYLKIHKSHPLWVQGLTEQGWTQIQIHDDAGAIGNMYSLHSPYFNVVYKPESYAVRTIGYINICQYGDAYRTLTKLERQHQQWLSKVDKFIKTKKQARDYYNTVANYIRGKSNKDVNGLPYQVIRDIARQRDFLNSQDSLNNKEDELGQYAFIHSLIKKEKSKIRWRMKKAKERIAKAKANIRKTKEDKSLIANLNEWKANIRNEKSLIANYKYELNLYEKSRKGYQGFRKSSERRLGKEKYRLKEKAGRALVKHMNAMSKQMGKIIENNEFLRYEIFAGSGENIRYQVAGGATSAVPRVPAHVKPTKILNWEFDGEYWEDEIGSYRSSLNNNCPKVGSIQGMKFKPKSK